MAPAQIAESSIANNSPSQGSSHSVQMTISIKGILLLSSNHVLTNHVCLHMGKGLLVVQCSCLIELTVL